MDRRRRAGSEKADVMMNLGAAGFVQKPFTLFYLAKTIADALKKDGAPA